jgi:hypothetical protein
MPVGRELVFLHQKQRDNQGRRGSKIKVTGCSRFKLSRFYVFFIWQAIVRGRLFLQRTFFLFTPDPPRRGAIKRQKGNKDNEVLH